MHIIFVVQNTPFVQYGWQWTLHNAHLVRDLHSGLFHNAHLVRDQHSGLFHNAHLVRDLHSGLFHNAHLVRDQHSGLFHNAHLVRDQHSGLFHNAHLVGDQHSGLFHNAHLVRDLHSGPFVQCIFGKGSTQWTLCITQCIFGKGSTTMDSGPFVFGKGSTVSLIMISMVTLAWHAGYQSLSTTILAASRGWYVIIPACTHLAKQPAVWVRVGGWCWLSWPILGSVIGLLPCVLMFLSVLSCVHWGGRNNEAVYINCLPACPGYLKHSWQLV